METCVCKHCNKLFNHMMKKTVCDDCKAIDEKQFQEIVEFLREHPGSNALEVAAGLNINPKIIVEYIDEGRLEIKKGTDEKALQ